MNITGLQKMTLLDFHGKVACTVFLQGCNFRCPFCHNSGLLDAADQDPIPVESLMDFLKKRQGILDGVCITGGEPTMQADLPDLLRQIKALGYAIKLDTNGSRPDVVKALAAENLIDYVAMDIKNSPHRYGETTGVPGISLGKLEETMQFLLNGTLDYEFRTTVVAEFHDDDSIAAMGQWLAGLSPHGTAKRLFLQPYMDCDSVLQQGLHTPEAEKLRAWASLLEPYAESITIRGVT